jgi:excisionase family DNA binding protein
MNSLLSLQEAAEKLNLSRHTLYKYAATDRIPHLKIGSRILFDPDVLIQWLHTKCRGPMKQEDQ